MQLTRREMLAGGGTAIAYGMVFGQTAHATVPSAPRKSQMTLGFTTYGMRQLTLSEAIDAIHNIGYDAIEIDTAGQHADPFAFPARLRKRTQDQLRARQLQLRSLMMHLVPSGDPKAGQRNLDRIKRTAELAKSLRPEEPPLLQTVLGGGKWNDKKTLFVDRIGRWLEALSDARVTLAIKPHRGGGMSRPSEAAWLIKQLGTPARLKMVYDYSHYAHRNMPLEATIRTSLPHTAHIAVKDAVLKDGQVQFDLPGRSGTFDYIPLLRRFHQGGYRGDVSCEVSSQVWRKKGYDPIAAAKICYANLAAAFSKAGIER